MADALELAAITHLSRTIQVSESQTAPGATALLHQPNHPAPGTRRSTLYYRIEGRLNVNKEGRRTVVTAEDLKRYTEATNLYVAEPRGAAPAKTMQTPI